MRRSFLLSNARIFLDGRFESCSLRIVGTRIEEIGASLQPTANDIHLPLEGVCVVPGLINAHDHLELNVFPKLGNPPYNNYKEWGNDIHGRHGDQIRQTLKVPLRLRLFWGAYKNVLSGVTTVVHHNPYSAHFRFGFPLEVYRNYSWAHSLAFDPKLRKKLGTAGGRTFIVHMAEGVDSLARDELAKFQALGGLRDNTVMVHGVGLSPEDCLAIAEAGAGLVWCPGSNMFLFNQTAPIETMPASIPVALGTDSTLTGPASLFDEVRAAHELKNLGGDRLLAMVTSIPARMFRMSSGKIVRGAPADLLVFAQRSSDPFTDFLSLDGSGVKLLIKSGVPIYGDESVMAVSSPGKRLDRVFVGGESKFITRPFCRIAGRIKAILPSFDFNGLPLELGEN